MENVGTRYHGNRGNIFTRPAENVNDPTSTLKEDNNVIYQLKLNKAAGIPWYDLLQWLFSWTRVEANEAPSRLPKLINQPFEIP